MHAFFDKYIKAIENTDPIKYTGKIISVNGFSIESEGPLSVLGELCTINVPSKNKQLLAEVIYLKGTKVGLMAYGNTEGIEIGESVIATGHILEASCSESLLGRVLGPTGKAIDGKGEIVPDCFYPSIAPVPSPINRLETNRRIVTGIRCIDSMLTVAKGQRLGIFAGSGVGKSTLLGMIARNSNSDVNVIALIGERNREVMDFINRDLGEEGLKKSVVIVATGDESPVAKLRASYIATAIAEYFRDQGKDVLFMMDNLTRFAQAQADIAISNGEPPKKGGIPASALNLIQQLCERTGNNDKGTITAFYATLVDGDNMDNPIPDTVRGVVDGHIIMDRNLFAKQHFPAIDIQYSISRLANRVNGPQSKKAIAIVKRWIALYASQEDFILSGVYEMGRNPELDVAIKKHMDIEEFLTQETDEHCTIEDTLTKLSQLAEIEIPPEEFVEQPGK